MASLTHSGATTVKRTLDIESLQLVDDQETYYELGRCVTWIRKGNYRKVCLQFPDDLLSDAPSVARTLTKHLGHHVYILGDTTYGSCCVDEVAAEHVGADAVIHFGRTCLSPSRKLPVLYIFTRIPVSISKVVSGIISAIEDLSSKLIFVCDTRCYYLQNAVTVKLHKHFPHFISSNLVERKYGDENTSKYENIHGQNKESVKSLKILAQNSASKTKNSDVIIFNGREVVIPTGHNVKDYKFIFLGPEGPTLTSMVLRFSENTFLCVNPSDGNVKLLSGIRSLMSRSNKLEIAKDAEIIGILVGTLGVADYCEVISRLKKLIKKVGKRSYTFVVGKPNEPKLCNIPEVDVFVYVSCPETAIIERQTDPALYKKLITPWELEVALLEGQEWSLEFESDFRQLLPGGTKHVELTDAPSEEQVNVSLLSNKVQQLGTSEVLLEEALDSSSGAVILANGLTVAKLHVGGAGELLQHHSWQGLDVSVPAPVSLNQVVEGRSGIASAYEDEKSVEHHVKY